MDLYLFVGSIIFWIIYYIFEGSHDAAFAKETKLLRDVIEKEKYSEIEGSFIKHELDWHLFDSLEKALTKIVFAILIYLITNNFLFAFQMLLLSVGIRSVMHDMVVALRLGKGLNHIGPDFLWWDRFLRKMQNIGINQYLIKLIPNVIILIWIISTLKQ